MSTNADPPSSGMNAPDFLVESIPNTLHGPAPARAARRWLALIAPLILSTAAGLLCYQSAGVSLALFLGGLILTALMAGPLMAAESTWLGRALAAIGISHGVPAVWLFATLNADLNLGLWAASYIVLISMVFAIAGLSVLLRTLRVGPIAAGAIVTTVSIAWLMWPLWLSPALHGPRGDRIVAWLVPAHPIFAINGVLRVPLGYWAEQAIAYNLTNLGDDIAYGIPDSVLPCALLHIALGAASVAIAFLIASRDSTRKATRSSGDT